MSKHYPMIGYSLACILPWPVIDPKKALKLIELLRLFGYDFLGLLPFRNINKIIASLPLPSYYLGGAWNAGNFRDFLCQKIKLHDWIFFPDVQESELSFQNLARIPGVQTVGQTIEELTKYDLAEVSPRMWRTVVGILQAIDGKTCLVLDTAHMRREANDFDRKFAPKGINLEQSLLSIWGVVISELIKFTSLVHIQCKDGQELECFLAGKPTELEEMLKLMKSLSYQGPYMAEFSIGLAGFNLPKLQTVAEQFLLRTKAILW